MISSGLKRRLRRTARQHHSIKVSPQSRERAVFKKQAERRTEGCPMPGKWRRNP